MGRDYILHSRGMRNGFLKWSYPQELEADATKKATLKKRDELLVHRNRSGEAFKGIIAALDYTPLIEGNIPCLSEP